MKRLVLALALGCASRIEDPALRDRAGGVSRVDVSAVGTLGTPDAPLPFSSEGVEFSLRVEVRDRAGARVTSFNGFVAIGIEPGVVLDLRAPGAVRNYLKLEGGFAEGVRVRVARGYGPSRVWAEESGYDPVDPRRSPAPACSNGLDDDGDGFVDYPADLGCAAANDDSERAGSFAAGTSEAIYFDTPSLADVQGRTAVSPLVDERVTVRGYPRPEAPPAGERRHRLVVTQTDNSGFFVTDLDDRSCDGMPCFNSMYSFNFRAPDGMRPCDLLLNLTGSVAEFVSTTQLAQPGYQIGLAWRPNDPVAGPCLIPDAVALDTAMVSNTALMERYESSLVRASGVTLPSIVGPLRPGDGVPRAGQTNCDFSGDGAIDYRDAAEADCANACDANPTCSEWSSWNRYGQLRVTLPGGGRVAVAVRAVDANYDPERPATTAATVTGTLRQVGPNWIINPRCDVDLALEGRPVRPTRESCLHERSLSEE